MQAWHTSIFEQSPTVKDLKAMTDEMGENWRNEKWLD